MARWRTRGAIELEVLLSATLLAILAGAFFAVSSYAQESMRLGGERTRAALLASEGIEAVRNVRDGAWNELTFAQSGVDATSGAWALLGEGTTETLGAYTRTITFEDVCRNGSDAIVACPGSYTDVQSKLVTSSVSWTTLLGVGQTVQETALVTNWDSQNWVQTDWSGGSGHAIWAVDTQYASDDGNVSIAPSGQVQLAQTGAACGTFSWDYDSAGDYTYDTGLIEVTGGQAQLVSTSVPTGFTSTPVDTFEFDPSSGTDTELYAISGDVYAVLYRGPGNDGWLQTLNIAAGGTITNTAIDTLEFAPSGATDPTMVQVATGIYAIAYEGSGSDGFVTTVGIAADGTISGVIDTLEYDTSNGEFPSLAHVTGTTYAIAYEGQSSDGFLATVSISAAGAISGPLDTYEFDTSDGTEPQLVMVDTDTAFITYNGPGNDGWMATVDIASDGTIGIVIDTFEYDTLQGLNPSVLELTANRFAVAYESAVPPGTVVTIGVSDAGIIDAAVTDSLTFELVDADQPRLASLGNGYYAIAYEGLSSDGFLALVDISSAGAIGSVLDTVEFEPTNGEDIALLFTGEVLLISYEGQSNDGFVTAISLTSTTSYATSVPDIVPTATASVGSIDQWTSFTESATKNGGEVYYQLSDDSGSTWYYWNGSSWFVAGASDYNTADVVDANIYAFPVSSGSLLVRAFLESDGAQHVQLDQVDVSCAVFQMEVGQVTVDDTWTTVNLVNEYSSPVVVASRFDPVNSLPASVRVRSAGPTSFEVRLENPSGTSISSNQVTYWVVEEGVWTHNTVKMEAHTHTTSTVGSQAGGWSGDTVSYKHSFGAAPMVAHQVMTDNDTTWISSFVSNDGSISNPPDTLDFWLGLNGAEVATTHGAETIGWIAMDEVSSGSIGSSVSYENEITPDTILGSGNGCYTRTLAQTYASTPLFLTFMQEMDGNNGGWALTCSESSTLVGLQVDEDQVGDAERSHTTETLGWIGFDQAFSYASSGTGGGGGGGGAYQPMAELLSSAFDMGQAGPVQTIEWDEDLSACPSTCDIQVQIRTAPDVSGAPGTWTDWYGEGGSGTNFTGGAAQLLSTDLNGNQWIQYRFELTSDGSATPVIQEIRINYR